MKKFRGVSIERLEAIIACMESHLTDHSEEAHEVALKKAKVEMNVTREELIALVYYLNK